MPSTIPLTLPTLGGDEYKALQQVLETYALAGDGYFGRAVEEHLREICRVPHALLTTSCSHALELAFLTLDLQPGDEVILPSFTFASTANAVALRGGRPVFVDIDPHTWNMDPQAVAAAITSRTKALIPVHYAGQGCDMHSLQAIAERHGLWVIEDAAQGVGASFDGAPLGSIGTMGCLSFHNTKNFTSGEGGALLTHNAELAQRAEIIREKGTNRASFFRGEADKYTWVAIGSSFVISDILAALLQAQLKRLQDVTEARRAVWWRYHERLTPLAAQKIIQLPTIHPLAQPNWHIFAVLVEPDRRDSILAGLRRRGIQAAFHYVPLHSAPAARQFGPQPHLPVTDYVSNSLIRLPLYAELTLEQQDYVIDAVYSEHGVRQ